MEESFYFPALFMGKGQAYRDLFRAHVDDGVVSEIRASWQTGTPLGNDRFREQIESVLNLKVGYSRRGRPTKA